MKSTIFSNLPGKNDKHLLASVSQICCCFISLIELLCFELSVGQKKPFESVICVKFERHFQTCEPALS